MFTLVFVCLSISVTGKLLHVFSIGLHDIYICIYIYIYIYIYINSIRKYKMHSRMIVLI